MRLTTIWCAAALVVFCLHSAIAQEASGQSAAVPAATEAVRRATASADIAEAVFNAAAERAEATRSAVSESTRAAVRASAEAVIDRASAAHDVIQEAISAAGAALSRHPNPTIEALEAYRTLIEKEISFLLSSARIGSVHTAAINDNYASFRADHNAAIEDVLSSHLAVIDLFPASEVLVEALEALKPAAEAYAAYDAAFAPIDDVVDARDEAYALLDELESAASAAAEAARSAAIEAESAAGLTAQSPNPSDFVEVAESAADEAVRAAVRAATASAALDEASAAIKPAQ